MHTFCSIRARRRLHLAVSTEKLSLIDPSCPLYHRLLYTVVFSALLFFPNITLATVIVPMSDTDLIQQSAAIVIGTVNTIESYWDADTKQIFTHVTVTPQEVLKGTVPVGNLTLKQLGGTVGQRHMWIDGSPVFTRGEKTILFLDANPDGSARVTQLFLGKFSVFTDRETRKEFAYRNHTPVGVHLHPQASPGDSVPTFAGEEFQEVTLLKERIQAALQHFSPGVPIAPAFLPPQLPVNTVSEQQESFVLARPVPIRWFEPDTGDPVIMSINPTDAIVGGEERIDTGFQAWNAAPDSVFRFHKGNKTNAEGFRADGVNAISFADPQNDLPNPIRCTGILAAVVHTSISNQARVLHGQIFLRINEADLVFADGWDDCDAFRNPTNLDEIVTHELGHVLGLGHSPSDESIMFALARFDGRGASLAQEDTDGVAFLYPGPSFPPCSYTLSASKRSVGGGASTGKVTVSTNSRCGWTTFTSADWISIVEGESSSGNGTVVYSVTANTGRKSRRARLVIAGQIFTITQKGVPAAPRKRPPPFAPA